MKEIGDGIFVETGFEGVNVGAIVTREGIVCIDAPSYSRDARDWVVQLERVHARPICLLILTDFHGDRILNTRWFNAPILSHYLAAKQLSSYEKRYPQVLIDSLRRRNPSGGRELAHSPVQRSSLSYTNSISLFFDPITIKLTHKPGPTPANTWISLPESGVLFVGDSVVSGTLPILADMDWYDWMTSLKELAAGEVLSNFLVPGRGDISDDGVIDDTKNYLLKVEETVLNLARQEGSPLNLNNTAQAMLAAFPTNNLPRDWMVKEITKGLERAYDQLVTQDENNVLEPTDR